MSDTLRRPYEELHAENQRLRDALAVYANPQHWALDRYDMDYPKCIWIGPGAESLPHPDPTRTARLVEEP
jgi:hypothetical protein